MIKLKNIKHKKLKTFEDQPNYTKLVIIITTVLAVIAGLYLYTGFFITGELRNNDETEEHFGSLINYSEILVGSIFTRTEDAYHVLIMDADDRNFNMIYGLASMSEMPLYNVDTTKTFNQAVIADENNITNDVNTLRVTNPTILLIQDGRITGHASGLEGIRNFLSD